MKRDPNFIAALEKAVREKYGDSAIINPKSGWDPEKEQSYIEQTKETYKKETKTEKSQEIVDFGGVLIAKKLINNNVDRQCRFCKKYSFNRDDDVYITKYKSCNICYIANIEGREDKWSNSK
jgi:hypothetical protein